MDTRTAILEALCEVVAEQGLPGVSIRSVASAAGVIPSRVQYWFRTKRDLITAAHDHVMNRFGSSLQVLCDGRPTESALRLGLSAWLPATEAQVRDARVWLAFVAAAATDVELAARAEQMDVELQEALAAIIDEIPIDDRRPRPDSGTAVSLLIALLDGLTVRCVTGGDVEQARADLQTGLDLVLGGPAPAEKGTKDQ